MRVREIMTEPVETVSAWAPVDKAARFMRGRDIGCLLATRKGKITGIVTVSDLLDLLGKRVERRAPGARAVPVKDVMATLAIARPRRTSRRSTSVKRWRRT